MMIFNKKLLGLTIMLMCIIGGIFEMIALLEEGQVYWLSNVFSYKFLNFVLIPCFIIGIHFIDNSYHVMSVIRYRSRKQSMLVQIFQQNLYIFFFLSAWFAVICFFLITIFEGSYHVGVKDLLKIMVRYYLGFLLVVNSINIVKKEKVKIISSSAYVFVYFVLVVENMLVEEINMYLPYDIHFLFSWINSNNECACIVMLGWNVLLMMFLFLHCTKVDMY